jgi:hypothetical protein
MSSKLTTGLTFARATNAIGTIGIIGSLVTESNYLILTLKSQILHQKLSINLNSVFAEATP